MWLMDYGYAVATAYQTVFWICFRTKEHSIVASGRMENQKFGVFTFDSKKGELGLLLPDGSVMSGACILC